MRLPNFKRLNKGDYSAEEQGLVEKLASSINIGIESLYEALNNRLTFKDNFAGTVVEIQVSVDSTGKPLQTTQFKLTNTNRVEGTLVIAANHATNPSIFPIGYPFVSFSVNGDIVTVRNVQGLQPNQPFIVKLVVLN